MADAAPATHVRIGDHGAPIRSLPDRIGELRTARLASLAADDRAGPSGGGPADDGNDGAIAAQALAASATFGITSLVCLLLITVLPTVALGWAATVIESSSMQPTVVRGDIVMLRPPDGRADIGAVVRFPADDGGSSIVHRVVEVDLEAEAYVTKGDANRSDDRALVPFDDVDGIGTVLVPLIGHPSLWLHEDRYALLAAAVAAGMLVIWIGFGAGRRLVTTRATPWPAHHSVPVSVPVLSGQPLGAWNLSRPLGHSLFGPTSSDRPGLASPGEP